MYCNNTVDAFWVLGSVSVCCVHVRWCVSARVYVCLSVDISVCVSECCGCVRLSHKAYSTDVLIPVVE